jgi:WXXGXW repeat (2 copies)
MTRPGVFAMRIVRTLALTILLGASLCPAIPAANAQVSIGISINIEPPPLPVYDQPVIPGPGYLWTPGYWAWNADIDDYYWVPGTWVQPPQPGLLWTPAYWAWNDDGAYVFNDGYWGPEIGFYGGVDYGYGYGGVGYEGGYWRDGAFFYNRTVNNLGGVSITNVYSKTVVVNNTSRASFNGGAGGTRARPTPQQLAFAKERHIPPTQEQTRHVQTAAKDPSLSLTKNQGHPAVAATAHPAQLTGPGVIAAKPGKPVVLLRPAAPAAGTPGTPANAGTPSKLGTPSHALPGFSQQPGGKPGPAGAATTGPGAAGPGAAGAGTAGPSTTGLGTAGDKKKKGPSSRGTTTLGTTTPGTTTLTPGTAKPVISPTPHPTTSTAIHTPPPPVVHQPPLPPPKPAPALAAKPVMPTPHAGPPPPPPHAGPPPAKPKCTPGQPCK